MITQRIPPTLQLEISKLHGNEDLDRKVVNLMKECINNIKSISLQQIIYRFIPLIPNPDFTTKSTFSFLMQENQTLVTEFVLLGFHGSQFLQLILFCVFLMIYNGTICGNLLIITLVFTSRNLHTPMYFFISQLSISDILLTTTVVPNMLILLLNYGGTMPFTNCMAQLYFFCATDGFECFLLTVMSYDRYVAICNPLRYTSIMTTARCVRLIIISWVLGLSTAFIDTLLTQMLHFCGPNIIDHFFCDFDPLLKVSCSGAYLVQVDLYLLSLPALIIPTIIIITSYVKIVSVILRIPSSIGRQKAFSTCSSHLIVVSIFYWTLFGVYIVPSGEESSTINKILSLLYTVFTPLMNPIIYSLRNKDIKKALQEVIKKYILHHNDL
ncbi:olfactory receptor 11L1-like [Engystomops pustulosus]|uniref:olfactory receptor 11L1-like n=1 Tax=Engystomops pustulosus TaxID=76066 RepID=UPI003AFB4CB9